MPTALAQIEISKWQSVRLFDVFLLGPFMIAAGATHRNTDIGGMLVMAGIGTIVLNGVNYLRQTELAK